MSTNEDGDSSQPTTFISESGEVIPYSSLSRVAEEHNATNELSTPPIHIAGDVYHPIVDSDIYTVTYTFADKEQIDVATDISLIPPETHSHAVEESVLEFTFITQHGKINRDLLRSNVHQVTVNENPHKVFTAPQDSPASQASKLEKYAAYHPYLVSSTQITPLLTRDEPDTVQCAVSALRAILPERVSDCISTIPALNQLLSRDLEPSIIEDILYCVLQIAKHSPKDAVTTAEHLSKYQTDTHTNIRKYALRVTIELLSNNQSVPCTDLSGLLAQLINTDGETEALTGSVLPLISQTHPETFTSHIQQLLTAYNTATTEETMIAITSTLSHVSECDPDAVIGVLDFVTTHVESDNARVRGNAVSILYHLAGKYPDDVATHIDAVITAYTPDIEYLTVNVTAVLSRLAVTHPAVVSENVDVLVDALNSPYDDVRLNAVSALDVIDTTDVDPEQIDSFIESESQSKAITRAVSIHNSLTN